MKSEEASRFFINHWPGSLSDYHEGLKAQTPFYTELADYITQNIKPATVLEIGCDKGLLTKELRLRGIDAWGVDYSIQNIQFDPDVESFVKTVSPDEPIKQYYDLIVCLEALNDLSELQVAHVITDICSHSHNILFSMAPYEIYGVRGQGYHQPGYWVNLFARQGFSHDLNVPQLIIVPWMMKFSRSKSVLSDIIDCYEDALWRSREEARARRMLGIGLSQEYSTNIGSFASLLQTQATQLQNQVEEIRTDRDRWKNSTTGLLNQLREEQSYRNRIYNELQDIRNSNGWRFLRSLDPIRYKLIPLDSRREKWMHRTLSWLRRAKREGFWKSIQLRREQPLNQSASAGTTQDSIDVTIVGQALLVEPVPNITEIKAHKAGVDIVICVHNALEDVRTCLRSVLLHTNEPYSIILVDDGSDLETKEYLSRFQREHNCRLIRNEQARGYTRAANQGLTASTSDFVILLNSDTIVSSDWLDRLITCALSDPRIGIVGPLSNTASWQSIPRIEENGDWASNLLPLDLSIDEMAKLVAQNSQCLYPPMKFLNGFCILVRRELIADIGLFDEENFGDGYGEEDDYTLRARKSGWKLALADDVYIFHAQSKSYSTEKRKLLTTNAGKQLVNKHGQEIVNEGVAYSMNNRVLMGIRARSEHYYERHHLIAQGREAFAGKRVLFILPVMFAGGGSNVVITEARAMRKMGVDTQIFNLKAYQVNFMNSNPNLDQPIIFGEIRDIPKLAAQYDAVIGTFNTTISWIAPSRAYKSDLIIGYYIQGFEPLIYIPDTQEYRDAFASYTLIPSMVRFTKTEWTEQQVLKNTGVKCHLIGVDVDTDLYLPRPRSSENHKPQPVRIGAMIRSQSAYRAPELTMDILKNVSTRYGSQKVEILLFGMDIRDPEFARLPTQFAWKTAGLLTQYQVARYMNELDIFVDFSSHQAMGLSALEAMACGVAVIVPINGGATSFARHEHNSLVIDTSSPEECLSSLQRLIEDEELRSKLQRNSIFDTSQFYPERPAYNILQALFNSPKKPL